MREDIPDDSLQADLKIVLDQDQLQGRCWRFGNDSGEVYAPFLRFVRGGRLTGYSHANEHGWTIRDDRVVLLDEAGRLSTVFDRCSIGNDGRFLLKGYHRDGITLHLLQEIPSGGGPASYSDDARLIQRRSAGTRRNLVVLRANEQSLHTSWAQDVPEQERSWDLCISYYGKPENFPPQDFSEYASLQHLDRKFIALKKLMHKDSVLWAYDYVMFPDDDLQMKWSDLNVLFEVCREYELQLAQPSLDPTGVVNYESTRQNSKYLLRFVSMVEIMAPVFSMAALRVCIHTFDFNLSGFGIDYAWSRLVDGPLTKIAIVDKVAVLHTRPSGKSYDYDAAIAEGHVVSKRYGHQDRYAVRELGGILAQ
jgi:hypothetical protein